MKRIAEKKADTARSRRDASSGQRKQKQRVAETKAMIAIKSAASTGQRLRAKTKAKLAFMAALNTKEQRWTSPAKAKYCPSKVKEAPKMRSLRN